MRGRNVFPSLAEDTIFYKTAPAPCPYLPDQEEIKVITPLDGSSPDIIHNALVKHGFRRSQSFVYKPACAKCDLCLSLRAVVKDYVPSKSEKRVLRAGARLRRRKVPPVLTEAQFELFQNYVGARHVGDEMSKMTHEDVRTMVEASTVRTFITEYYDPEEIGGALAGWVIVDELDDGLSLVYSVFRPEDEKRSPGVYAVLDHIQYAKNLKKPYLYLGYWVPGSMKMDYKKRFTPFEIYRRGVWRRFESFEAAEAALLGCALEM